jgi:hypothetical protein
VEALSRALAYLVQAQVEAEASDLQRAIALAEPDYHKNPHDWPNTFNLAVYYLAAEFRLFVAHHRRLCYLYRCVSLANRNTVSFAGSSAQR